MSVTRRQFLRRSAAAAVALGCRWSPVRRVLGANEEIRVAVVGCGVRGGTHVAEFGPQPGVRIAAVCDPDRERVAAFAKRVEASYGYRPAEVGDVRQLMDRKDLDVISVATMQYWHSLPTIWACETGRHVYVEKPLAHYIWEGRQMVNAARKYNRLVQIGTQARSRDTDRQVIDYIRSGQLGKIQYIVCFANKGADVDRQTQRAAADPGNARLRFVVRPGPQGTDLPQPYSVRLQFHLEHGRRRIVQPRRPRGGCRPLAAGRNHAAAASDEHRRPLYVQRCRRRAEHADHVL